MKIVIDNNNPNGKQELNKVSIRCFKKTSFELLLTDDELKEISIDLFVPSSGEERRIKLKEWMN